MALLYAEKLNTLKERVHSLNPRLVTVGWFSRSRCNDACIPLSDLRVVTLEKSNGEWMVLSMPAIHKHGMVHVDGRWFERNAGRGVNYTTEATAGCRPAGVRKALSPRRARDIPFRYLNPEKEADQRLIDCAYEMTDNDMLEAQPDFNKFGDDFLPVPTFLSPISSRGHAMLREGKELDQAVLHCARFGRWNIRGVPGLVAPSHGKAELMEDKYHVKFTHADRDGDPCAVEELFRPPAAEVREKIYAVFGVEPMLELSAVPVEGEAVWLQPPQCLFAPVPAGSYKLADLAKHKNYQAMRYMAALNSVEGPHGLFMLDHSLAHSELVPWVHMDSLPSRLSRVKNVRQAMCSEGGDHRVMLFDLGRTLTASWQHVSKLKKEAEDRKAAKPEGAQPLRESAEAAGS